MNHSLERDIMEGRTNEAPRSSANEAFDEPASKETEGFAGEDAYTDRQTNSFLRQQSPINRLPAVGISGI